MVTLEIPDDLEIQAAVGRIAMHHSQLLYVARLTIKTINLELHNEALGKLAGRSGETLQEGKKMRSRSIWPTTSRLY
jgi:hypothetical protein